LATGYFVITKGLPVKDTIIGNSSEIGGEWIKVPTNQG
jgi:hypothetical protein